jgi:predicted SAM-dependent methyltransferase
MYENESVDYFVLHHVIEHFGCGEAASLIAEAHRVLRKGSSLLVFVPDMHALYRGWITGKISTQIYMTNVYGAYMGNEDDRHKWGYDAASLYEFLKANGDWKATPFIERTIPGADLAIDWWILGMEATK